MVNTGKIEVVTGKEDTGKKAIENLKDSIISELKECLPTLLRDEMAKLSTKPSVEAPKKLEVTKIKHSLILKPKTQGEEKQASFTKETWSEVTKKNLSGKLSNLPIEKSKLTSKGMGFLHFPNKDSRDKAAETLEKEYNVKIEDKNVKSVFPKIKISGINKESFNKELVFQK